MSSTPPSGGRLFVEPLEARIAPTVLFANDPAYKGSPGYIDYSTPAAAGQTSTGFVLASTLGIAPNDPTVHALRLTTGDELVLFNQATGFNTSTPFLQITSGNAIAFFKDKNGDGQVSGDELVGLALSKKGGANVGGSVDGDIVTNLANDGSLMLGSAGKPGFALTHLSVAGNVNGSIISGGNLGTGATNSIQVTGTAHNVFAGTAANGVTFNFSGTPGEVSGTIADPTYKDFSPGASIAGLTINGVTPGGLIKAGAGGFSAAGGNVTNLNVQSDTDAFSILGGTGGGGNATVHAGAGGAVNQVLVQGVADSVVNHLIFVEGGTGGVNPVGKAGAGGSVSQIATSFQQGFNFAMNSGTQSADLLAQSISVQGGTGGDGLRGGAGGAVTMSSLFGAIPADGTDTPEIQAVGGNGGHDTGADGTGKGGAGGQVNSVTAENLDTLADANASTILLQGGNGLTGKDGGGVSGVVLLGKSLFVNGGNGGDGYNVGGNGGSLLGVSVINLPNLFTSQLTLNAGQGGNAGGGNGGDGGGIGTVNLADADLTSLSINTGTHGNGGSSEGAHGGTGGAVSGLTLTDTSPSSFLTNLPAAPVAVRAGAGGNGQTGGGDGGGISNFTLLGTGFNYTLTAGAGGSVNSGGTGNGGVGGGLMQVGVSNFLDITNLSQNASVLSGAVTAGAGGAGTITGGQGGGLTSVIVNAGADIAMQAGNGGSGGTGADGAGGTVTQNCGANSLFGGVTLKAGDAGQSGASAGDGGAISFFTATAGTDISMTGGSGHAGGVGGAISNSGTTVNQFTSLPNAGNLIVHAGDGSSGNNVAGVGGDINTFNGYVGTDGSTTFTAGNGGGGNGQAKVGAGGSVEQVILRGTNEQFGTSAFVAFDAGSAGTSNTAKRGANGGNIDTVVLSDLDSGTLVHHFAAGDASNGINRGGTGGSVTTVHVGVPGDLVADIGLRTGAAFGYAANQTGGIFAGLGGSGAKSSGNNGDVKIVTAAAISGIVAGKAADPGLVNTVDSIDLEGLGNLPLANADGSFSNFDTANLVGSIYNNGNGPTAAGASTYKPGDGLIASLGLPTNINFIPQALLTLVNGQRILTDLQQPNEVAVSEPAPANLA